MLKYKKVFDLITKKWVTRPYDTDPSRVEYGIPGEERLKAIGHYKGMKGRSFCEMTPEEQKLFIDTEEENDDESKEN
jgi:hypothetical protein